MRALVALVLLWFAMGLAHAQSTEAEERSGLLKFIEDKISAPNMQIRLNGISGTLSSNVTLDSITIADDDGIWLQINKPALQWDRGALLSGRIEIEKLAAESIDFPRKPLPSNALPSPEAGGFAIPELPVAVILRQLDVSSIRFGEPIFGLASQASVNGRLVLDAGALDTQLAIKRLDGPGGSLDLTAAFSPGTKEFTLDLALAEPGDGMVATLLKIPGTPPVGLTISGQGPLDKLDLNLGFDVAGKRILDGALDLRGTRDGRDVALAAQGPIGTIIAERFQPLFGQNTKLDAKATLFTAGGMRIERLNLDSGAIVIGASASTLADGFLADLNLDAEILPRNGQSVLLPVGENGISAEALRATIAYGGATPDRWRASIRGQNVKSPDATLGTLNLDADGTLADLADAANRALTFTVTGAATGIVSSDDAVTQAFGQGVTMAGSGDWRANQPIAVERLTVAASRISAGFSGTIDAGTIDGQYRIESDDLSAIAPLVGRPIGGQVELAATGTVLPLSGGFDLALTGMAKGLRTGIDRLDPLLVTPTALTGGVARGSDGLAFRAFNLSNSDLAITANGKIDSKTAKLDAALAIANLAKLDERAEGRADLATAINGVDGTFDVVATLAVPRGKLLERPLQDATLNFSGTLRGDAVNGTVKGKGFYATDNIAIDARITRADTGLTIDDLLAVFGPSRLSGTLATDETGLITGDLALKSSDIRTAAAFALADATGAIDLIAKLSATGGKQQVAAKGTVNGIAYNSFRIGEAAIDATINDATGTPRIDATLDGRNVTAGSTVIEAIAGTIRTADKRTAYDLSARLENGTAIASKGSAEFDGDRIAADIEALTIDSTIAKARLVKPVSILRDNGTVRFDGLTLEVGGGTIIASGSAGDILDIETTIEALPLAIANAFRPDLKLAGTLSGTAEVTGSASRPAASFSLAATGFSAAPVANGGISPLSVTVTGAFADQTLRLDSASIRNNQGIQLDASGRIPIDGNGLDVNATIAALPLSIVNAMRPDLGLAGSLSGSARASGSIANPQATFTLNAAGFSVAQLANVGVSPLAITAGGSFAERTIRLDNATARNNQGLDINASGVVPLAGPGLALNVDGQAPLALAAPALAARGTSLDGTARFNVSAAGVLASPTLSGLLSVENAAVSDPLSNLRLNGVTLLAGFDGNQLSINRASAQIGRGGAISATGTVGLSNGFPADIAVQLDNVSYADGRTLAATAGGSLRLTGPLAGDPLLSGTVNLAQAEITVPESSGASTDLLQVENRNAPADVRETLARIDRANPAPTPTGRPSIMRVDISLTAPARIFVRGRGIDAELGGSVRLTGPVTAIEPVGAFTLRRGRLSIIGRRLDFQDGTVTLVGDLDPFINFTASTSADDVEAIITVKGRASNPEVSFSSSPELPQDEVLARIIFGKSLTDLSPVQIARLASIASELAGGGGSSIVDSLRGATGLDELDVVTDSQGNAAVKAGRYISDNVYLGVEAGADTKATINLDVTDALTVRGAVDSKGDSSLGIFFEKDY
jgi:translocation and assembly module TamB